MGWGIETHNKQFLKVSSNPNHNLFSVELLHWLHAILPEKIRAGDFNFS